MGRKRKPTVRLDGYLLGFFDHDGETFPLFNYDKHLCMDGRSVGTYLEYSTNNLQNKEARMSNGFDRRPLKQKARGAWNGKCILFKVAELRRLVCKGERPEKLKALMDAAERAYAMNEYRSCRKKPSEYAGAITCDPTLVEPEKQILGEPQKTLFDLKQQGPSGPITLRTKDDKIQELESRISVLEARLNWFMERQAYKKQEPAPMLEPTVDDILDSVDTLVFLVNQFKKNKGGTNDGPGIQEN